MAWPTLEFSKGQVNRAGRILADDTSDPPTRAWAMQVLGNWRSCHGYPINTFQATLREKLRSIDPNSLVAQRLKRTPSIVSKLRREVGMDLARMQDIGGLRAVVESIDEVYILRRSYSESHFRHVLVREDDYIAHPKTSGYRSIHLVYAYHNPRAPAYDTLRLELQIRTKLQHAWATAVETVGIFQQSALKSSEGPDEWLDFFSLAGSAFARLEGFPVVPEHGNSSQKELFRAVSTAADNLQVGMKLEFYQVAASKISEDRKAGSFHLITLNPLERRASIRAFGRSHLDEANEAYMEAEARRDAGESLEVVLVSAGSVAMLKRAYPNFFGDTLEFTNQLALIKRLARY
jgi:putative GTP pyrophosphokinase